MAPPPSPWKPEQCSVVAEEMKCLVHVCRIIQIMKAPVPWNCFLCSLRHRSCFIGLFLLHGKGLSSMGSTPAPVYLNLLLIRFRALNSGFSRSREVWFDTCSRIPKLINIIHRLFKFSAFPKSFCRIFGNWFIIIRQFLNFYNFPFDFIFDIVYLIKF